MNAIIGITGGGLSIFFLLLGLAFWGTCVTEVRRHAVTGEWLFIGTVFGLVSFMFALSLAGITKWMLA